MFEGELENGIMKNGTLVWHEEENQIEHKNIYRGAFDEYELFTGKGELINKFGRYVGNFVRGLKDGDGVF